jgi:hypothetical protein
MEKEKLVFERENDYKGFNVKAWYLLPPHQADALIEIYKDGQILREFLFPAYKVWNIAAHFYDIVDGELQKSDIGYRIAGSNGLEALS